MRAEATVRKGSNLPFRGKGGKVRNRCVSPVAPRPGEGPLTEPTAGAQPWPRERVLMPQSRPSTAGQGSSIFLAQSEARAHASAEREGSRLTNRIVPHPHHAECPLPHSFWRFAQARLR